MALLSSQGSTNYQNEKVYLQAVQDSEGIWEALSPKGASGLFKKVDSFLGQEPPPLTNTKACRADPTVCWLSRPAFKHGPRRATDPTNILAPPFQPDCCQLRVRANGRSEIKLPWAWEVIRGCLFLFLDARTEVLSCNQKREELRKITGLSGATRDGAHVQNVAGNEGVGEGRASLARKWN